MMRHFVLLTLAVLCVAFAPAPFPKPPRPKQNLTVQNLVGTWRIKAMYHLPNKAPQDPAKMGATHVTISLAGWEFKGSAAATYDLRIDNTKTPSEFDLMQPGQKQPYGQGLIRREGEAIRVIYRWDGRPAGFENQRAGCELLLVRE